MLDSPFWEEQRALEREKERALEQVRERTRTLLKFAKARKLALPPDAEQRLTQLEPAALEQLIDLVVAEPEAAKQALLIAVSREGR